MNVICPLSGMEFKVEHFPGSIYSKETFHPIFHLEQKKLLPYLKNWASGGLTKTDSYLLFLALFKSSELVEFRVPVFRTEKTDAIIYNNMEFLARTVSKINAVQVPSLRFSQVVITPDTRFLNNIQIWIQNWDHDYQAFAAGKHKDYDDRKLVRREMALQRLIKNPHKSISAYASEIAEWASIAGSFPSGNVPSPFSKLPISLSDYWREIIRRCTRNELLYSIPKTDLEELIEHCEDNVPAGSIYSNALFKALRTALAKHKNFLALGDYDIKGGYSIIGEDDTTESANMQALIASAPIEEPRREQFETHFKFLQAQMRWKMSKRYGSANERGEL